MISDKLHVVDSWEEQFQMPEKDKTKIKYIFPFPSMIALLTHSQNK